MELLQKCIKLAACQLSLWTYVKLALIPSNKESKIAIDFFFFIAYPDEVSHREEEGINPFKYTLKISQKAKRARLQMSPQEGLVVIVPKRFNVSLVPALLEKKKGWIRRIADRFKKQWKALRSLSPQKFPETINLRAIDEVWTIEYQETVASSLSIQEIGEKRLLICGPIKQVKAVHVLLHHWVLQKANEHLIPWLSRLSEESQLKVQRISIRSQRTRWGSCSSKKNISLNLRLLFLDPSLVRYVFLHELAHLKEMNHSARFWALVAKLEPEYAHLRKELRHVGPQIPHWLDQRCGLRSLM